MSENDNSKLFDDWDKQIINEYRNLYKMRRYNGMRKLISWELYERLRFWHISKWYMHKPEYVLENEMHKILLYF